MKKKIISILMVLIFTVCGFGSLELNVKAEEAEIIGTTEDLDFSYFTIENSLIGYMNMSTRGVYLAEGNSFISKMGTNKIGAGGITNAALRCKVSISSVVEKYNAGGWEFVTSWTQTNQNALSAAISKSLIVGGGYYYRVRSVHYAGTDVSSSWTNALSM